MDREWVVTWSTSGRQWVPALADFRGVKCLVTLKERLVTASD